MMGIRTPIKKAVAKPPNRSPQDSLKEAGPSPNVGDLVSRLEKRKSSTTSPMSNEASPPKPTTAEPRRESLERSTTYIKTYTSRTKEAQVCLVKVKQQLVISKNLKREIKVAVTEAAERLYQLVKDIEMEQKSGTKKARETNGGKEEPESLENERSALELHPTNEATSQLLAKIEEHSLLLLNSNTQMEELRTAIQAQSDRKESAEVKTYAGVTTAGSSSALNKRALHSIVVTSDSDQDTGEEVYERVRKVMNAKDGWIKVEKVRKAKDRKVIMGFETREEREIVKERLRMKGAGLAVEEMKNKNPMLILRDVLAINTDEDVLKALSNQNRDVFHGLDGETSKVEIRFRKRARNPHTGHIVVTVSPTVWRRTIEKGYVYIDLQRIRVEDQTPLMQCTRCLGFGHSKKLCAETVDLCSHCGGPHLRAECSDWMAGLPAACKNCKIADGAQFEHNAFSTECPQRKKWDELARTSVAYC